MSTRLPHPRQDAPRPSSLRIAALGIIALAPLANPAPAAPVTTPAEWDAAMVQYYGANFIPIKSQNLLPDQDAFAWSGYLWLEAYVALAQATGDSKYMDTAKQIIDYEFSLRDDVRFATTPLTPQYYSGPTYYLFNDGTPAKGWRRISNGKSEIGQLIDGRICESIILWCELARRGFPQYEDAIDSYLPKIKETLDMHLPSFFDVPATQSVPTGHYYTPAYPAKSFKYWRDEKNGQPQTEAAATWSAFIPINHNATFARAMLGYDSLTGTTTYHDKVQGVVNLYLNALDTARPSAAFWMYSPLDGNLHNPEDVNHATVDLTLIQEAYRIGGYGVTASHVSRLVQTFNTFYNASTKGVSTYIDGTGNSELATPQTASITTKAWLWFSQFDASIAARGRTTLSNHFPNISSPAVMAGWANLIYWERRNTGTAVFDDSSISTHRPPVVGFEPGEGCVIGNSPAGWSGTGLLFTVAAVGYGSPQGILSAARTATSLVAFSNLSRNATAADFGGNTAPVTAGYSGLVGGSFDIAISETATNPDATQSWFLRFGDNGELEFFLRANGSLEIRSTAGSVIAKNSAGATFTLGSMYKKISFTMNFATKTTQVWVDGVPQTISSGSVNIPWQASPWQPRFAYVRLQANVSNTDQRYPRIKIDNIRYHVP